MDALLACKLPHASVVLVVCGTHSLGSQSLFLLLALRCKSSRCILMVVGVELGDSVALVLGVWEWRERPSHICSLSKGSLSFSPIAPS